MAIKCDKKKVFPEVHLIVQMQLRNNNVLPFTNVTLFISSANVPNSNVLV